MILIHIRPNCNTGKLLDSLRNLETLEAFVLVLEAEKMIGIIFRGFLNEAAMAKANPDVS